MARTDNDLSVTLPEELRRQFAVLQRRLWRVETTVAVCRVVVGLVLSLFSLFVSDRFWNTPPWLRVFFLLLGLAVIAGSFYQWARRWVWNRPDLKNLANLVQKKYRRLGDRLLGIVELAQEQRHQANFSPALYHAAIHQVADEARTYDFRQSISVQPAKKLALGAGIAAAGWLFLSLALPQASWNAFLRWIAPTAAISRYTLVSLEGVPAEVIVPHGESFSISGLVRYRSFWKPQHVVGQLGPLPDLTGQVESGKINLPVPGQVEDGVLHLKVGDARAAVKILPVYRPSLQQLTAEIQLPDYLQYPKQTQILLNGSLLAVEGSRVAFNGKVSRALVSAGMQSEDGNATPLKIEGENFISSPAQPDALAQYTFNWQDTLGLSNAAPLRLSVQLQKDAPPIPEISELPRETAMLASDVLHVRVQANDDFGVRDLGLIWNLTADSPLTESVTTEIKVQTSSSHVKKAEKTFLWSPSEFRIPADSTVELQAYARDYFPERERSRTSPYRIRVLSPEEHAELVREQLEAVMAQVEEVTRLQEKIAANLRDVKDSEKLPESQKSARIGQSKDDQLENSAHLDQLSKEGERAVQEAMKNPIFPEESIRQWSQSMQQWQKLSEDKMKDAASSMQSAQQNSKPGSQDMADSVKKADDILKALEKMQGNANQHMDDLQALTLSQRLHKIGAQEKEIGAQLIKTAPDTIGMLPQELPEKFKHFESSLTQDQGHAQKESDSLEGEISRFFERTQKTNYGQVSKEMKESHTGNELDRVGGLIGDNIGIEASGNLSQWSDRFQKWSEDLKPKPGGNSQSGQGSSGDSKKKDLTEQLIQLLRLRENEENLRDQTTVVDQQKSDPAAFKQKAVSLSDNQKQLAGDLETIHQKANLKELEKAFGQTAEAMKQVQSVLQKPETGAPADQAEGKAIDALSDLVNLINEQAQQSNPQQSPGSASSAEEMAFLLKMMQKPGEGKAMALQPATGLNHAGGSTDRSSGSTSGNTSGKGAAARTVDKAAGVIENSPTEFRDALDNYFHGIEQSKE